MIEKLTKILKYIAVIAICYTICLAMYKYDHIRWKLDIHNIVTSEIEASRE